MTEPPPDAGAGVNSIETKLDSLIATVDQQSEAVNQRFEAVDRRFDGVERRLDRVEIAVEDIRDQVKLIAEGHAATQALIHRKFDEVVARFDRHSSETLYAGGNRPGGACGGGGSQR